jgi:hypothetical protein
MARNMKMELHTFSLILYQSKKCGHRIHVLFMMYDVYWYCQMKKKRMIMKILKGNPSVFYTFYLVYIWHCRIKLFLRHLPNCPCSNFSLYVDLFQEISPRIARQLIQMVVVPFLGNNPSAVMFFQRFIFPAKTLWENYSERIWVFHCK